MSSIQLALAGVALVGVAAFGAYVHARLNPVAACPAATVASDTTARETVRTVTKVITVQEPAPNGPRTTTTTETTQDQAKVEQSTARSAAPVPTVVPYRPGYSVGVHVAPRLDKDAYKPTGVTLGYRVLGNAWIEGGFDWRYHEATVGIRVDF